MSNTTRPATPRRPDRPAGVSMNLDTLQREAITEPFVVVIAGRSREMADPGEMDWQELEAAAEDPRMILQMAMSEDDYRDVIAERIPAWKIRKLALAYIDHYGFEPKVAEGNAAASPR